MVFHRAMGIRVIHVSSRECPTRLERLEKRKDHAIHRSPVTTLEEKD